MQLIRTLNPQYSVGAGNPSLEYGTPSQYQTFYRSDFEPLWRTFCLFFDWLVCFVGLFDCHTMQRWLRCQRVLVCVWAYLISQPAEQPGVVAALQ